MQTTTNSNGSLNVFFGNGQPLVVGTTATSLAAVASSGNPGRLTVGVTSLNGRIGFAATALQPLPNFARTVGDELGVLQRMVG